MKKLFTTVFLLSGFWASAQNADAIKYANTITADDLKDYLSILASDALEGRETGERGQKMAAAFIEEHFITNGLIGPIDGGYQQDFNLEQVLRGETSLTAKDEKFKLWDDFAIAGDMSSDTPMTLNLIYVGNGEEADFEGLDLKGKIVAIKAAGLPELRGKIAVAKEKGADGVVVIGYETKEEFDDFMKQYGGYFKGGNITFPKKEDEQKSENLILITYTDVAAKLLGTTKKKMDAGKKIKPATAQFMSKMDVRKLNSENVLGYLEGTDKKDELIVITAHYDHEGVKDGEIYNGADDDGSGTSSVLEIAQAFSLASSNGKGPRRSILFMTVSGEEKGLLGSEYYSEHPIFPLENTVANLNIDMVGRIDAEHVDDPNYVYIIGSTMLSSELHELSESTNEMYSDIKLDYKFNSKDDPNRFYYRSDHYNFAKHGIPVIFYFNGTHDDYHQPSDTIEKIEFELMAKRAQLVFYTAWELANRENRVVVDQPVE